jgi:tryptophan synthase alpha chain
VPFLTAGDPDLEFTLQAIRQLANAGVDAIELGVPFSDPIADGPVIQRSAQRALQSGVTLEKIFSLVREARQSISIPILLMGYYNPILCYGVNRAAKSLAQAGGDGLIIPDLPPEQAAELVAACREHNLAPIFLAAPTSTPQRLRQVAKLSQGYVYYVSVTGTTGSRELLPEDLAQNIQRLRRITTKPILVGFGVSNSDQARSIAEFADGVIIGSAIVRIIEQASNSGQALQEITQFASAVLDALNKKKS